VINGFICGLIVLATNIKVGWLVRGKPELDISLKNNGHYRNRVLCRVFKTLGKDYFTLGKGFTECNTRQRTLGKYFIGKDFVECQKALGKDFVECQKALGKEKHSAN
jgi:hypothetical protein